MQDVIDRARHIDKLGDIVLDDSKSRVAREMSQVGRSAGDQVVDRENLPATIEEVVAKVRPEKSGASRDYRAQWAGLFLQMFSV
jgi:alpha-galactosidase